jgi:hypothetical protein
MSASRMSAEQMSAKKNSPIHSSLLCALLLSLSGCVPWPHHVLSAPEIIGSIESSGGPVAHAHIQLSDTFDASGNVAAKAKTLEVVADDRGHFRIGPIRRFVWTSHFGDRPVPWGLSFSTGGQPLRAGWLSDPSGNGFVLDEPVIAICDLHSPTVSSSIGGYQQLRGNGLCSMAVVGSK